MINFESFVEWQKAGHRRSVKIEIGDPESDRIEVWVYDYDLQVGQFVKSIDEIDLEGKKKLELQAMLAQYEMLDKKETAEAAQ